MKFTDHINNKQYNIEEVNAKAISVAIKGKLLELGIDHTKYNSEIVEESNYNYGQQKDSIENPPHEIYQYQNFFLLKDGDGYLLLDGFRRLLWYNPPNMDILVRVYD